MLDSGLRVHCYYFHRPQTSAGSVVVLQPVVGQRLVGLGTRLPGVAPCGTAVSPGAAADADTPAGTHVP